MVFSSLTFLLIFLPVIWLLYQFPLGMKYKNGLLLLASLLFYAMGEPRYLLLLLISSLLNYAFGHLVIRNSRGIWLGLAVTLNVLILCICKYTSIPDHLPVGVSFYTFQAMSYVIDVYREPKNLQKNPLKLLLYISFFPQLIAGPIVKYHDIARQMDDRKTSMEGTAHGLRRFFVGLGKKVLIANTVGQIVDVAYGMPSQGIELNAFIAWSATILYCLQIYYDFSGYSDMALGLAELFGFQLKENFLHPYGATSMKDFWRRWHVSLSTWFKEYLYIPFGGNRKGKLRTYLNKYLVFFCTGIWHGAGVNFIIWGLMHGTFTVLEEQQGFQKFLNKHKLIGWIYAMFVVIIAFVFFRAEGFMEALTMLKAMFTGIASSEIALAYYLPYFSPYAITMAIAGIVFMFPWSKICEKAWMQTSIASIASYVVSFGILLLCIMSLATSSYNPFIYYRF